MYKIRVFAHGTARKNVITATNNQITQNSRQTLRYPPAGTKALKREAANATYRYTSSKKMAPSPFFTPLSKNSRNKRNAKRDWHLNNYYRQRSLTRAAQRTRLQRCEPSPGESETGNKYRTNVPPIHLPLAPNPVRSTALGLTSN